MLLHELQQKRPEILQLAAQYGAKNLRVFGSVARGESNQNSDIDFLVNMQSSLLARIALIQDLETLLGTKVDVVTETGVHEYLRTRILKEERFYLIHIVQCIEKIEQYTQAGKSTFLTDTKTNGSNSF